MPPPGLKFSRTKAKFDVVIVAANLEHSYEPWSCATRYPAMADAGWVHTSFPFPYTGHNSLIAALLTEDIPEYQRYPASSGPNAYPVFRHRRISRLSSMTQASAISGSQFVVRLPEQTGDSAHAWDNSIRPLRIQLSKNQFGECSYQVVAEGHAHAVREREGSSPRPTPPLFGRRLSLFRGRESAQNTPHQPLVSPSC